MVLFFSSKGKHFKLHWVAVAEKNIPIEGQSFFKLTNLKWHLIWLIYVEDCQIYAYIWIYLWKFVNYYVRQNNKNTNTLHDLLNVLKRKRISHYVAFVTLINMTQQNTNYLWESIVCSAYVFNMSFGSVKILERITMPFCCTQTLARLSSINGILEFIVNKNQLHAEWTL